MPETDHAFQFSAVVLCGGNSERMGFDKFRLPLGERTFLECVVSTLLDSFRGPVVCVANTDSQNAVAETLTGLSTDRVHVLVDERDNSGPLEGIRVGLKKAADFSPWVFVTSCDVPLLVPAVVASLQSRAEVAEHGVEAVIPRSEKRIFGMTAMYKSSVHSQIDSLIEAAQLKVSGLATELNATMIDIETLRQLDPQFDSVRNLNLPSQYLRFLEEKGFPCPPEIRQRLSLGSDKNE